MKVKDKYQDMKSKASSKRTRNLKTGNRPVKTYFPWETRIIDFLLEKKSDAIDGLAVGFDLSEVKLKISYANGSCAFFYSMYCCMVFAYQ